MYSPWSQHQDKPVYEHPLEYAPVHARVILDPGHPLGVSKFQPERYFISCDHGRRYFVINYDKRREWATWLEDWDGFSPTPEWAVPVNDGLSNVTFERPEGM